MKDLGQGRYEVEYLLIFGERDIDPQNYDAWVASTSAEARGKPEYAASAR